MSFFVTVVLVVLVLAEGRHSAAHSGVQPGGQVGSSQQHEVLAAVLGATDLSVVVQSHGPAHTDGHLGVSTFLQHDVQHSTDCFAVTRLRQAGGQTSEQPGGQVGSRQQSAALVVRMLVGTSPAHTPAAVSDSSATASIHDRLVIG